MSENNQNQNNGNSEKHENAPVKNGQSGQNGQNQNRRNRHRPNKGGNRPRPEHTERENGEARSSSAVADAPARNREDHRNNTNKNQNQHPQKKNGNPNGEKRRNDNRGGPRGKGNRRPQESRPYDPYEAPSKEEIALSELRAKIVMKAADGTTPTAYGTQPAPASNVQDTAVSANAAEAPIADVPLFPAPETPSPVTAETKKVEVVGVRFRSAGKMYYFDPRGIRAQKGDFAIVETTRGPEFGDVCLGNTMVNVNDTVAPLRPLLRIATPADIAQNQENREKEKHALTVCQEKIRAHKLDMKLIDVQYAFDGSKLLFYFASEGRVDFRDLVKDLASVFRTRIELRQIGIRDEAKMLGGIGACGRALCCSTFLPDFAQVSIKMAKDQNLSLNSAKISGVCGRLMCCLRFESEVYTEEIRKTPAHDSLVRTEDGIGTVIGSNPLAGTVRVVLKDSPDTAPKQYHRDNVTVLPKERKRAEAPKDSSEN